MTMVTKSNTSKKRPWPKNLDAKPLPDDAKDFPAWYARENLYSYLRDHYVFFDRLKRLNKQIERQNRHEKQKSDG